MAYTHAPLSLEAVDIRYGDKQAVTGVTLAVRAGSVHALIGPNGSGKSSLIHTLLGINKPAAGKARIHGCDVYAPQSNLTALRRCCGTVPDEDDLIGLLSGQEYVALAGALHRLPGSLIKARTKSLARMFGMSAVIHTPIDTYSHGMRKKTAFMAAMIAKPDIYIIDEPTNGLDPDAVELIKDIIVELKGMGASVLLASHNLLFAEAVADEVTMLRSRVLAQGSVCQLLQQTGSPNLEQAYLSLSSRRQSHDTVTSYLAT